MNILKSSVSGRNVPVLPTFGNNDVVFHDQATFEDIEQYYTYMYHLAFDNQVAKPVDHNTFMKGGYYLYDFEDRKISMIAMNTIFYMTKNKSKRNVGAE